MPTYRLPNMTGLRFDEGPNKGLVVTRNGNKITCVQDGVPLVATDDGSLKPKDVLPIKRDAGYVDPEDTTPLPAEFFRVLDAPESIGLTFIHE